LGPGVHDKIGTWVLLYPSSRPQVGTRLPKGGRTGYGSHSAGNRVGALPSQIPFSIADLVIVGDRFCDRGLRFCARGIFCWSRYAVGYRDGMRMAFRLASCATESLGCRVLPLSNSPPVRGRGRCCSMLVTESLGLDSPPCLAPGGHSPLGAILPPPAPPSPGGGRVRTEWWYGNERDPESSSG